MKPTAILKLVRALIASGVTRFEGFGISFDVRPAAPSPTQMPEVMYTATTGTTTPTPAASAHTLKQDTLAELIGKPRPSRNAE